MIAIRQRRRMGRPKKPKKTPKWQTGIDNMSPWYAMGLAPLTQPWGLVAAGVATITEAKMAFLGRLSRHHRVWPLSRTGVYIVMGLLVGFRPEEGQALLTRLRTWIDTHTDQVIIIVALVLGLWLVGKSVYLLVT